MKRSIFISPKTPAWFFTAAVLTTMAQAAAASVIDPPSIPSETRHFHVSQEMTTSPGQNTGAIGGFAKNKFTDLHTITPTVTTGIIKVEAERNLFKDTSYNTIRESGSNGGEFKSNSEVSKDFTGETGNSGSVAETALNPSLLLQDEFIHDARQAIDLLYNREYENSLDRLSNWKNHHPDHPIWLLWESLDAWWPVLVDLENTSFDDNFLNITFELIDYCDTILKQNENNLDAMIIRSIATGQIARYYSNRGRWYRSFRSGRRALNDLFLMEETHPELPDLNFGIGMYRYFSAFLVEEYTLARRLRWMLPKGDRREGLERLTEAADSSIFLEPEATFFLGHIYLNFERKPGLALNYLKDLYYRYPDNTYYRRLYVRSLFQLEFYTDALRYIEESMAHPDNPRKHEANVMMEDLHTIRGQIYFKNNQYDLATDDFVEAVKIAETLHPFGDRANLVISLHHLGEISLQNDQRINARYYFSRAATAESDHPLVKKSREILRENNLE